MASDVLDEAYGRLHHWGPEFGRRERAEQSRADGRGGAGPARLLATRSRTWLDRYVTRLVDAARAGRPDHRGQLGRGDGGLSRVGDWVAFFRREVREAPWPQVLAAWWPRLLPAIASGATHGLIRTGHAVRTVLERPCDTTPDAVDEIAHALGYWAARAIFVPGLAAPAGRSRRPDRAGRPAPAAGAERDDPRPVRPPGRPAGLDALAHHPARARAAPAEVTAALASLVEAGVRQYATPGYGSPVLLVHVATAPNAMGHLLPALPQPLWPSSFAATWAACAAITVAYAPAAPRPTPADPAADPAAPAGLMARAAEPRRRARHQADRHRPGRLRADRRPRSPDRRHPLRRPHRPAPLTPFASRTPRSLHHLS